MIRKIVGASILVFSFLLCAANEVSAQTSAKNNTEQYTKTKGKIRITTSYATLQNTTTAQEPSIEQLQNSIKKFESEIADLKQNPSSIKQETLIKSENALAGLQEALKQRQENN